MNSENYIEQAKQFTKDLWHSYLSFPETEAELNAFIQCFAPQATVIGTGKHEFYQNRDAFLEGLNKDLEESGLDLFEVHDEWYQAVSLGHSFYLAYGTLWVQEKPVPGKTLLVDMDTRFTLLLERRDDSFVVHHVHHSLPYLYQQEDEYYPKTFVNQAEEAIRRADFLERQVEIDLLTGLYNRIYTEQHINTLLKKDFHGVFFVLDLDDFKQVNDTLGHLKGDQILKQFAQLLKEIFPATAIIGRVGGDEFIIFIPNISPVTAEQLAQTLIACYREFLQQFNLPISCSIGLALPDRFSHFENLYHSADKALYYAKRQGKQKFSWFQKNT